MFSSVRSYNELIELKNSEDEYMADEKKITHMPHNVTMNDCRNLTLTGVEEVIGCDEELLTLKSSMGEMTVGGRGMHIGSFNRGSGELKIDGLIREIIYADPEPDTKGFFKRLFK